MQSYIDILHDIRQNGVITKNRTGIDTIKIPSSRFVHNMADGFPLLTTKKIKLANVASELEFFLKGITDKTWLQERGNPIWNAWCSPDKVPYSTDSEVQKRMAEERDLGPIYGFQWRHFGANYLDCDTDYTGQGVDQVKNLIDMLKQNPTDRRMIVSAWNPADLDKMALPPCHYSLQVVVSNNKLHLNWNQRSVDVPVGLPFNIASYALLLHLLTKETDLEEGTLTGNLTDTHIYLNQIKGVEKQLARPTRKLPEIITDNFTSIFDWKYTDSRVEGYNPQPFIKFPVAT
jgi:thymidylate synthase